MKVVTRTLPRRERIRRRPDFLRVQNGGVRTRGRYLTLFARPNGLDVHRLGVVATRRLGGAIVRNRCKRLVREIYRHHKPRATQPTDYVVMPRPGFSTRPFPTLTSDFLTAVGRYERAH